MGETQNSESLVFKLNTPTGIKTGGVEGNTTLLHETGIRGGIRWWYEALVRGLGGYACDPSKEKDRCQLDSKKFKETFQNYKNIKLALDEQICTVCQFFGCPGWAAKFRIEIRDSKGNFINALDENLDFDIIFIQNSQKRPFEQHEKWLLQKTFYILTKYGSIGKGFSGLITYRERNIENAKESSISKEEVIKILEETMNRRFKDRISIQDAQEKWPNLNWFFFGEGDLDLEEGKHIFTFRKFRKFWGYCQNKEMLESVLKALSSVKCLKTGCEVIEVRKNEL